MEAAAANDPRKESSDPHSVTFDIIIILDFDGSFVNIFPAKNFTMRITIICLEGRDETDEELAAHPCPPRSPFDFNFCPRIPGDD